ncbi:MAG: Rieske (2Fe-2S) protein [Acidobacteriia bacterium]|jgi:nitrite reductase/ring-hydroxylating ferredoxin subunit|nr:Rieske (2Fe-2S) protein [Terriglobia bacterium]
MQGNGWIAVARLEELPSGRVRGVDAAGRRIVLVHLDGQVYALDARCPHQGGPLDEGEIYLGALVCPWHNFRYDPRTGENVFPANVYPDDMPQLRDQLRAATCLPVQVRDGLIFVRL